MGPAVPQALLTPPEAGLPAGAVVVRPSLWAALDTILRLLGAILGILAPVIIPALIFLLLFGDTRDLPGERGPSGAPFFALEVAGEYAPALVAAFIPAIRLAFTRYSFGPEDLRVKRQILEREEQRVEWSKVTAIRYRRTLFDRLFGLHRMDVVAYGKRGTTVHLVGLRDGPALRDLVAQKMRESSSVDTLFEND